MEAEKISKVLIKKVPDMEEFLMGSLWEEGPVVIIFFRRFGCLFCRQSAKEISLIAPILMEHGVRFVGVGMDQMGLEEFCAEKYFSGELFIDPGMENYKKLGFKKIGYIAMISVMMNRKSYQVYKKARAEGTKNENNGDGFQSGGAIVVSKGGSEVLFSFKQDNPADFVPNTEILKSLGIGELETESVCSSPA